MSLHALSVVARNGILLTEMVHESDTGGQTALSKSLIYHLARGLSIY